MFSAARLFRPLLLALALLFAAPMPAEAGLLGWLRPAKESKRQKLTKQIRKNQKDGAFRETVVGFWLWLRHPMSRVEDQRVLVDGKGKPIVDKASGETRRFDSAVIGPTGRLVRLVEVTSSTADKKAQEQKTRNILKKQKAYVASADGSLHRVRDGWFFPTRISTIRTPF